MFLCCSWQLKEKIVLMFNFLSANAKSLMGIFVRIMRKNEFWSLKCKALNIMEIYKNK